MDNIIDDQSVRKIVQCYAKVQDTKNAIQEIIIREDLNIEILDRMVDYLDSIDLVVKRPMSTYSANKVVGRWAASQYGIGPVYTAGLISHIDITKARTAGSVWRYAGFDPSYSEQKYYFNGELKNICFKIGQSFAKYSNKKQCFYGKLYLQDKTRRIEKNNNLDYADKAADILKKDSFRYQDDVIDLNNGKLPLEHIEAQARRFAVKIFLSHYHAVAYQDYYGIPPSRPSYINIEGFEQEVDIPNNPFS